MPTLTTSYQKIGESEYTVVGRNYLRLYAKYNSQDIANNKTSVTMQLRTIAITGNYWSSGNYSTLNCGGDRGTLWYDIGTVNTSSEKEIGTWTFDLYHNDNGTYSGSGYATANVYGNIVPSVSGGFDLPTIARASQPSATSGNIEENIVIYTNRKSSSFTHTISYSFGSLSGTIATGVGDSTTWTLPSTFYAQMPNQKSKTGTITCTTYNGGTNIGTKTCQFTAYTSESRCKPTITLDVVDTNTDCTTLTGSNKKLIKFFSNAQATLTTTAQNSATISTTSILCGDGKSATNTTSFSTTFNAVESAYFKGNVTDSRGYTNSVEATGLTIVDYIKLTLNPIEIYRPSQTGSQIKIKGSGNYFNGSFSTNNNNTLTFKYRYREYGDTTWGSYTTINPTITNNTYSFDVSAGNSFDYRKQYEFQFVANDELMEVILEETSKPGIPLMWLGKNYMEFDGKKGFDWEDDNLTIDDDIYLGTTGMQIKNLEPINIETDGTPVKTGRKIDGRDEYIYCLDFGYLPSSGRAYKSTPIASSELYEVVEVYGIGTRQPTQQTPIKTFFVLGGSRADSLSTQIGIIPEILNDYLEIAIEVGVDRSDTYAKVFIKFTYND